MPAPVSRVLYLNLHVHRRAWNTFEGGLPQARLVGQTKLCFEQ
jgi:hypothetical protein